MEAVANWADMYRLAHKETAQWHFVDMELDETMYDASKDCVDKDKSNEVGGDCAVEAIKHFSQVVKDPKASDQQRFMALKFIIHFVGDIHQPLHAADNHDHGGNDLEVTWFGRPTNLHKVWDGLIIKEAELTPEEFASELEADITATGVAQVQKGTFETWVTESHMLAKQYAYPDALANHALGNDYYDKTAPIVNEQLAKGGLRLAQVLNILFQ